MGLSNSPKETVTAIQVLLEIAESVRILTDDPKSLEKLIVMAYALPEQEQAKAETARQSIETYQNLVAEQKNNLAALERKASELASEKSSIDTQTEALSKKQTMLESAKNDLETSTLELRSGQKELETERFKLEAEKQKNIEFRNTLDARDKQISAYELSLRTKADQLRVLTEGL